MEAEAALATEGAGGGDGEDGEEEEDAEARRRRVAAAFAGGEEEVGEGGDVGALEEVIATWLGGGVERTLRKLSAKCVRAAPRSLAPLRPKTNPGRRGSALRACPDGAD